MEFLAERKFDVASQKEQQKFKIPKLAPEAEAKNKPKSDSVENRGRSEEKPSTSKARSRSSSKSSAKEDPKRQCT